MATLAEQIKIEREKIANGPLANYLWKMIWPHKESIVHILAHDVRPETYFDMDIINKQAWIAVQRENGYYGHKFSFIRDGLLVLATKRDYNIARIEVRMA